MDTDTFKPCSVVRKSLDACVLVTQLCVMGQAGFFCCLFFSSICTEELFGVMCHLNPNL